MATCLASLAAPTAQRLPVLERVLTGEDPVVLMAQVDDEPVGYGKVEFKSGQAPPDPAPSGYYLSGVAVVPKWRRMGAGAELTRLRLEWVWSRAGEAWYFANAMNRASLDLHARFGFEEVARGPTFLGITFEGGVGVLFRATRPAQECSVTS